MKKIIVASKNPVKINATKAAFAKMFPDETFTVESVPIQSDVSDQPKTDEETYRGAYNRAMNARQASPDADYWVGLEGGIEAKDTEMEAFAWMYVQSKEGLSGKGRTGTFFLPPQVAELILQGKELGEADDIVFGQINSKQQNGAVGLLTHNAITRSGYYEIALVLALIPFKNPSLYTS